MSKTTKQMSITKFFNELKNCAHNYVWTDDGAIRGTVKRGKNKYHVCCPLVAVHRSTTGRLIDNWDAIYDESPVNMNMNLREEIAEASDTSEDDFEFSYSDDCEKLKKLRRRIKQAVGLK